MKVENKEKISIEEAKKILIEQEKLEIKNATEELNEFVNSWMEKHNCRISICGIFEDNRMNPELKVLKVK